jgi:protein ImuB
MLWIAVHLPGLAAQDLEPLAAWACQFTPRVALEPQVLLLEVEGSLRYCGGREALLDALHRGLREFGLNASLATAQTGLAALWRAKGADAPLEELPVGVLGTDQSFFASLGIDTLGQLLALPREGLAQRCGQGLLDQLDRALGRLPETREFFTPPERFTARLDLPAEVVHAEALLFGARRLLMQLEGLLAARHAGVRGFVLRLRHVRGAASAVQVELASATRDAERMSQLLREKLFALVLSQPVEAMQVEAGDFVPLAGRSRGLFGDRAAEAEDWMQLVERLQARLGRDAVCGISPCPDHRPEHAWRRVEPGDWDPREFVQPGPRPAWLLGKVISIEEEKLDLVAGPERIACGWWDGDETKRDYFVAGYGCALAWVYREEGRWFLHGFFA